METRLNIQQTVEPNLALILMVLFSFGTGLYVQEHLNRACGATGSHVPATPSLAPPAPVLA